jgi:tetratricopeptide (TPR) repeat protein
LGYDLYTQGRLDEAEPFVEEAMERARRVLGSRDSRTLMAIYNMATLRDLQGRFDLAEPLYVETIQGKREVQGEESPDTLLSTVGIAHRFQQAGRPQTARELLERCYPRSVRVHGSNHRTTLQALGGLRTAYRMLGIQEDPEGLYHAYLAECVELAVQGEADTRTLHWLAEEFLHSPMEGVRDLEQAIHIADIAVEASEHEDPRSLMLLASALEADGDRSGAIEAVEEALELVPEDDPARASMEEFLDTLLDPTEETDGGD